MNYHPQPFAQAANPNVSVLLKLASLEILLMALRHKPICNKNRNSAIAVFAKQGLFCKTRLVLQIERMPWMLLSDCMAYNQTAASSALSDKIVHCRKLLGAGHIYYVHSQLLTAGQLLTACDTTAQADGQIA
jgi:hypothetical protein